LIAMWRAPEHIYCAQICHPLTGSKESFNFD
jgi:hypothetical protein